MPNYKTILGNWKEGYALDLHTSWSTFVGYDEFGHAKYDTQRTDLGELLYRFKYRADSGAMAGILDAVEEMMRWWNPGVDIIVPVPPTTQRAIQPVFALTGAIGSRLGIPWVDCVRRARDTPQLKSVFDLDQRTELLKGLHHVEGEVVRGKTVLLFDDLYRSGATMSAVAGALRAGGAVDVYALTVTRTRSNQ